MEHLRKLVTVVLLLWIPVVWSEELNETWLKMLIEASDNTDYRGHTVVLKDGKLSSFSVLHSVVDGEVWERVVSLSGPAVEVVRKGDEVYCSRPHGDARIASRAPLNKLNTLEKSLSGIAQYYRFQKKGEDRVANRLALVLEAIPKDDHRFGYQMWLDEEKGVLLKMVTLAPSKETLETFEYVTIQFDQPLEQAEFEPSSKAGSYGKGKANTVNQNVKPVVVSWEPGWLPPGFRVVRELGALLHKPGVSSRMYTDGLAAVTVFHHAGETQNSEHVQTFGATVAYDKSVDNALITVVGEVPLATAERIAREIKPTLAVDR